MLKRSFGAIKPIAEHRYAPEEELGGIIEKMMKIDLKARYQTMDDVVTELEQFPDGTTRPPRPAGPSRRNPKRTKSSSTRSFCRASSKSRPKLPQPAKPAPKPVPSKSILCVETQTEIQDAFRKTLSTMGYKVCLVSDAEVAAERYRETPVDAVIFDTDGQDADSFDAFLDMHELAHEDGHQLVALVLLGLKQDDFASACPRATSSSFSTSRSR